MLKAVPIPQVDYSGGLNCNENPLAVADNETPDCNNVIPGLFKSISRRKGKVDLNSSAIGAAVKHNCIFDFAVTDSNHKLMAIGDANIYKMDSFDGTWDAITDTVGLNDDRGEIRSFYAGAAYATITNYNPVNIQSWDGSAGATATISGAAAFKYQWPDEGTGRLWTAGLASNGPIAYFTPIATLTFDTTNDKIQISTDGSDVLAYRSLKGNLFSWTTTGIYRINDLGGGTGSARFGVKRVDNSRGTRSPQSLQVVNVLGLGEGVMYLDTSRQIQFFDGYNTIPISLKINTRGTGSDAHSLDRVSAANLEDVHAVAFNELNSYILFYQEDSDTDFDNALLYNTVLKSWWPLTGILAYASGVAYNSGTEMLYIGGDTGVTWRLFNGNDDDGANISSFYTWNRKSPQKGYQSKFRQGNFSTNATSSGDVLALEARTNFNSGFQTLGNLGLSPSGDLLGTTFILGTSVLGGIDGKIIPMRIDRIGKLLQMKISNNAGNTPWSLFGDEMSVKVIGVH